MKHILKVGDRVRINLAGGMVEAEISSIELLDNPASNDNGIEVPAVPFCALSHAVVFYNNDQKWAYGSQVWRIVNDGEV